MTRKLKPLFKKLAAMDKKRGTVAAYVENEYLDNEGTAIININLKNADNLFSPYSEKKTLNQELMRYIDSQADPLPPELPLVINFIVDDVSKVDQEFIRRAIKRYYWLSYKAMTKEWRRIMITSLVFLLIGVGILALYETLNRLDIDIFINPFILIASWVFIWEAFSSFMFNRREKQVERINEGQMAVATVRFENRPRAEQSANPPKTKKTTR
jgi:hypothetical protein